MAIESDDISVVFLAEEGDGHGRSNVKRLPPSPTDAAGTDAAAPFRDSGHEGLGDGSHHRSLLR